MKHICSYFRLYLFFIALDIFFVFPVWGENFQLEPVDSHLSSIPTLPDKKIDLAKTLFKVSQDWRLTIKEKTFFSTLDEITQAVQSKLDSHTKPEKIVDVLRNEIHQKAGFDYTDEVDAQGLPLNPEELFIHGLLETRKGYCMTLSLMYLIIGERLDLPLYGVALPNHFFVRYDSPDYRANIETTQGGILLPDSYYYERFGVSSQIPFFMKNLSKKKTLGAYFSNVGMIYYRQGRSQKAVFYLEQAIRINPHSLEARNNLGNIYSELKQYDKAIQHYQGALNSDPNSFATFFNLGIAYSDSGQIEKAIETFLQVLSIDSNYHQAHQDLARLYLKQKKPLNALVHLKKLSQLEPGNISTLLNLATVYLQLNQPQLALRPLKQVERMNPDHHQLKEKLAEAFYKSGKYEQAIDQYRLLIERRPEDLRIYIQLGWTHYRRGDIGMALAWTRQGMNRGKGPLSLITLAQMNLGLFHVLDAQFEKAKDWYRKALSGETSFTLKGLIQDLAEAQQGDSRIPEIEFFKGWVFDQFGRNVKASKHFKSYLMHSPKGPLAQEAKEYLKKDPSSEQDQKIPRDNLSEKPLKISLEGMVEITAGYFLMGSEIKSEDEKPQHKVLLNTYWIDRYEVSAKQFAEFLNAKGNRKYYQDNLFGVIQFNKNYKPKPGFENYPANNISWFGARAFCRWKGKRLPTEAEWEKAARGTDGRVYPWGDSPPTEDKARFRQTWDQIKLKVMVPVDSLNEGKSPYGIHHLSGNVKEWVDDWYDREYYVDPDHHNNPPGPLGGEFKVLKGGSWRDLKGFLYSSYRNNSNPDFRLEDYGFRCAKSQAKGRRKLIKYDPLG